MTKGKRGGCPSPQQLDQFLLGDMAPGQAAPVVVHLLRGCAACRQRMAPLASAVFASGPLAPPPAPRSSAEYDFPLFKAFAAARQYAESRSREKRHGHGSRKLFPIEAPSLETSMPAAGLRDLRQPCEELFERCRSLRFSDPEGMVLAASLAVTLAERAAARKGRSDELSDFQARAWAELGNAYRVADDLPSAEAALAHALDVSSQGTGDALLLARIMDLTASLYTDQRRFEEAFLLLDCVHAIYQDAGDPHLAGRALISKGISAGHSSRSEEAMSLLARGLLLTEASRDPKVTLIAVHGLLWFLVDCGRLTEVRGLLPAVRDLYVSHAEGLLGLRARWLEGRVAAGLGEDSDSEQTFLAVRQSLLEAGQPYDAALVSLDLATVWLRQGKTAEIKDLVDEMVAIFQARDIRREAIAALLLLRRALQRDQATAALVQAMAAELRQLERLPAPKSHIPG